MGLPKKVLFYLTLLVGLTGYGDPYLNLMVDPYEKEPTLQEKIFDKKISDRLLDHYRDVEAQEKFRSHAPGPEFQTEREAKKEQENRRTLSGWVLKKLVQHHGERSLEEAPKESALGRANTLRSVIQNYEIKVDENTKINGGYDLPSNTLRASVASVYGNHAVEAKFDESKFGPTSRSYEVALTNSKNVKFIETNFTSNYRIRSQTWRLSADKQIISNVSVGVSRTMYPKRNNQVSEDFIGVQYVRGF